jgi:hypothetical protein
VNLGSTIAKQEREIHDAINSYSDLNSYFKNADTDANWSLTESGTFAAGALATLSVGLIENAAKTAPALLGESGSIPTAVWTNSGQVAGIGTPAFSETMQAASTARDIGALSEAAQSVTPDVARDVAGETGGDAVKRIVDPAGRLAEVNIEAGDDLSQQNYDTIKSMQQALKRNLDLYHSK